MEVKDHQVLVLQSLRSLCRLAQPQPLAGMERARWAHPAFVGRQLGAAVALDGQAG